MKVGLEEALRSMEEGELALVTLSAPEYFFCPSADAINSAAAAVAVATSSASGGSAGSAASPSASAVDTAAAAAASAAGRMLKFHGYGADLPVDGAIEFEMELVSVGEAKQVCVAMA